MESLSNIIPHVFIYFSIVFVRVMHFLIEIFLKRDFELYIPSYIDVNELPEGKIKENYVEVSKKNILSTKIEKKELIITKSEFEKG